LSKAASQAGKAPSQRQLRVAEEIRHVLAGVFGRGEFRDPDLADARITVAEVRISPDLKHATVFVSRLGRSDVAALLPGLRRAGRYLRGQVDLAEVRAELDAQIRKVREAGVAIGHLDGHQHVHVLPGIAAIVAELAAAYGIGAVRYPAERVRAISLENVVAQLNNLRTHPSVAAAIARGEYHIDARKVAEKLMSGDDLFA